MNFRDLKKQYEVLKKHTISRLKSVINFFEKDDLDSISKFLASSDSINYINMAYKPNETMDIGDIIYKLNEYNIS